MKTLLSLILALLLPVMAHAAPIGVGIRFDQFTASPIL